MVWHSDPVSDDQHRRMEIVRTGPLRYRATNSRGTTLDLGSGDTDDFTPVELLLVALAGCGAVDVDGITGKRAEPVRFVVTAEGDKVRDEHGNHLVDLRIDFDVAFDDDDDGGRAAEGVLARAVEMSQDRLCTVSRTIQLGAEVRASIRGQQQPDVG